MCTGGMPCVCVCVANMVCANVELQEMVCSSCHPFIGTWQMKNVCPSLCNDWYAALSY